MRTLLLLVPVFLPQPLKRAWYRTVLGWTIGRGVRIGFSFLDARRLTLGDHVRIGHFNTMRHVQVCEIGESTYIANFNTFAGTLHADDGYVKEIRIGCACFIMSRHFFDVSGSITIGDDVTLAGRGTQLWTHTLDLSVRKLAAKSLSLGEYCYVGSSAILLFCHLPPSTLVGAGAVVTKSFDAVEGAIVLAGNPAVIKKVYPV